MVLLHVKFEQIPTIDLNATANPWWNTTFKPAERGLMAHTFKSGRAIFIEPERMSGELMS